MFITRRTLVCLLAIITINTTYPMMDAIKNFNPIELVKEYPKAALLTGLGALGTSIFGYTTYSLWQQNKKLKSQIANVQISQKFNSDFFSPNNQLQQLQQLRRKHTDQINYFQWLLQKNNDEKQTLIKKLNDLNANIAAFQSASMIPINNCDKGKEKIDESLSSITIPFSSYNEKQIQKLAEEFENDLTIVNESEKTKEKESEASSSSSYPPSMLASLTIEQYPTQFAQAERYKNYKLVTKKIINNRVNTNKTIVLIVVHGTFVNGNEYGINEDFQISDSLLDFAKKLARDQQCNVGFSTFEWSGALDSADRNEAGTVLAKFITKHAERNQEIWVISHSHGANVLYPAAEQLREWGPITYGITIASPRNDSEEATPVKVTPRVVENSSAAKNIQNHINIYSTGDITQTVGSLQTALFKGSFNLERRVPFMMNEWHKVWNIRLQDNGCELNHISIIVPAIKILPQLIPVIKKTFAHIHDLDVNNDPASYQPQVAIRHLIISKGGLRTLKHALKYSYKSAQNFEKIYGKNIYDKVQYTVTKMLSETKDAACSFFGIKTRVKIN